MTRRLAWAAAAVLTLLTAVATAAPPDTEQALQDRVLGRADAPVTIIEYASLTCSHCRKVHTEVIPQLKKDYIDTGKVKLIYRDFPFDRLALMGAVLARCAPEDRFFSFIDVLFAQQENWARSEDPFAALTRIGKLGGVNPSDFDACLKNQPLVDGIVEKRLAGQKNFDVNATPTFIIDGNHRIVGAQPYEEFKKVLDKKVK